MVLHSQGHPVHAKHDAFVKMGIFLNLAEIEGICNMHHWLKGCNLHHWLKMR